MIKNVFVRNCSLLIGVMFSAQLMAQQPNSLPTTSLPVPTPGAVVAQKPAIIPAAPQLAATGYILVDATTGNIIAENNSEERLPPASLTKMMSSYLIADDIEKGRIAEDTMVNISVKAWKMGGSRMYIREGTQVSVIDLLRGVIIQSGNDATVALAEYASGNEDAFVDRMNQKAQQLGMANSHFENSTGWPAEGHLTTAKDLAVLARAIINDHPSHYPIYAEKYFFYNNIRQPNRNLLLFRDETVDGLKTGHTEEAGYCLVASSKRENTRLIAVVMGTNSEKARAAETQKLLAYGFRFFQTTPLYQAGQQLSTNRVWAGTTDEVGLGIPNAITLTLPKGREQSLVANMHINEVIKAPIEVGQELGNLTIELDGQLLVNSPIVALHAVAEAGFFARMMDNIKLFLRDLFS
jgi:serine-type D-Ala-D-Ala carboxypeptidase (penicillin-binding protein 5/6)